jgi:hypothetical protein
MSDNSDSSIKKSEMAVLRIVVTTTRVHVTQIDAENCVHDVRDEVAKIDGSSPKWAELRKIQDAYREMFTRIEAKMNALPERVREVVRQEYRDCYFVHGDDFDEY